MTSRIHKGPCLLKELLNSSGCFQICNAYLLICNFTLIVTWFPFAVLYEEEFHEEAKRVIVVCS